MNLSDSPNLLKRHPKSAGGEGVRLWAEATRPRGGLLRLSYQGSGDMGEIRVPAPAAPKRVDELWLHTCFEAFVRATDGAYYEFNFAPSTQWAAYRFRDYRMGMANAQVTAPEIQGWWRAGAYELQVELSLESLTDLPPDKRWWVGLSAILEDAAGDRSYWALAHAPGKPDFHHPDSFALDLPPPDPS